MATKSAPPTPAERRQAALSGTEPGRAPTAVFILHLGDAHTWLRRWMPTVTWGPRSYALRFKTIDAARRVADRLRKHGRVTIDQVDA